MLPEWANPPAITGWSHHNNYSDAEVVWTNDKTGEIAIQYSPDRTVFPHSIPPSPSPSRSSRRVREVLGGAVGGSVAAVILHFVNKI